MQTKLLRLLVIALMATLPCCCLSAFAQFSLESVSDDNPAVAAIMQLPRESTSQELQAIFTLIDLGEMDAAAELWKSFSQREPDDTAMRQLVSQFGTARFLKLARQDREQFAGAENFVTKSLETTARFARDPKRLSELIGKLSDPSEEVRNAARVDLAATSTAGAAACLEALANATTKQERTNLLLAILELRPEADPLVVAVLANSRGQLRRDLCELTGHMRLTQGMPWLAAFCSGVGNDSSVVSAAISALSKQGFSLPSPAEARALIWTEIRRAEAGISSSRRPSVEIDNWWNFDSSTGKLTALELPRQSRELLATERLARILLDLPGATLADQRTALIYAYQVAQELDQPLEEALQERVIALDVAELSHALELALKEHSLLASKTLIQLLGQRQDPFALKSVAGNPAPLAKALKHPERSVRFLALQSIMKIQPTETFAGASGVAPALWFFATGAGKPQTIAASSQLGVSQEWSGFLRGLGYDAISTATGSETIRQAVQSTRLQFLILDSDISRPALREVIYQLRSNLSTAHTPIAIFSSLENLAEAKELAETHEHLFAVPRPHRHEVMNDLVERLQQELSEETLREERIAQAIQALNWLGELLDTGHPYDELLRGSEKVGQTLFVEELTKPSLRVLAVLGTSTSQHHLVDLASSGVASIETREAAVAAFATSVQRFGKLLSNDQLQRQYDRYNASESADAETQAVLGRVLDVLESRP